jgi:hypothetical protein
MPGIDLRPLQVHGHQAEMERGIHEAPERSRFDEARHLGWRL